MLMPSPTRDSIPVSAYEKQNQIPEKERCSTCRGLGWTCWKHSYPNNEYHICVICDGTGRTDKMRTPV
jgi:hypothetical protein